MSRRPLHQSKHRSTTALQALDKRNPKDPSVYPSGKGKVKKWKQDVLLTPILHRHHKPNLFRDGDYVHVSDLLYKCPRMVALIRQQTRPVPLAPLTESTALTFAVGESIHDYIRSKLKIAEAGSLYGGWSCACKQSVRYGTCDEAKDVGICPRCEQPLTEYHELVLRNDEIMVTGSVDTTLLIDGHFLFVEIKSINKNAWDQLTKPVPEHLIQVLFYWWLAKEAGLDIYDAVAVLYINKDFQFVGSPYKEFFVYPSVQMKRLADYLEDARMIKAAKEGGPLPYRTCPNVAATEAKKCPMVVPCFHKP